ncbi:hypothetical protein M422DRAFT_161611, partial [Sphaerobolus stellatus SS14]
YIIIIYLGLRIEGTRLPPGPPPKPIIGNAFDMPTSKDWKTYEKWSREYGMYENCELVYLNILGQGMLIVNSRRLTYELFDKRSSIYSDRSSTPMLTEL